MRVLSMGQRAAFRRASLDYGFWDGTTWEMSRLFMSGL